MDYNALKSELDAGHPDTGAYDADDALAAGELNAENRTVNYPVELDGLNLAIRESGKWTSFSEKAALQTVEGTYDNQSMFEFMGLFPSLTGANSLDLQGTYMSGLLDACVAEGSMGQGVADGISAFGDKVVSRAVELEFGTIRTSDVDYARNI